MARPELEEEHYGDAEPVVLALGEVQRTLAQLLFTMRSIERIAVALSDAVAAPAAPALVPRQLRACDECRRQHTGRCTRGVPCVQCTAAGAHCTYSFIAKRRRGKSESDRSDKRPRGAAAQ